MGFPLPETTGVLTAACGPQEAFAKSPQHSPAPPTPRASGHTCSFSWKPEDVPHLPACHLGNDPHEGLSQERCLPGRTRPISTLPRARHQPCAHTCRELTTMTSRAGATKAQMAPLCRDSQQLRREAGPLLQQLEPPALALGTFLQKELPGQPQGSLGTTS